MIFRFQSLTILRIRLTITWHLWIGVGAVKGFQKEKNMRVNPKVALLAFNPGKPLRNIEVRGCVEEMTTEGALKHLNELNQLYTRKPKFFGNSIAEELSSKFIPIKIKIKPMRIRIEG